MIRYAISAGNPFDGLTIYLGPDGEPFSSSDHASFYADNHFDGEEWSIIPLIMAGADDDDPLSKEQKEQILAVAVERLIEACKADKDYLREICRSYLNFLPMQCCLDHISSSHSECCERLGFDPNTGATSGG